MWAHSRTGRSRGRHRLADHLRGTAGLAAEFARPWGAAALAAALGLFHDAGKASCAWQDRLDVVEGTSRRVGVDHKFVGTWLLRDVADYASMAVFGHHGGLPAATELRGLLRAPVDRMDAETVRRFYAEVPEARAVAEGGLLVPAAWSRSDPLLREFGLRMVFSALVDADRLDTAAHARGHSTPDVRGPVDMGVLLERFEKGRVELLGRRRRSPMDEVRGEVYAAALAAAQRERGVYRLPAPTGSGKTLAQAAFGLAHAAEHGMRRVIVAVPFITITEQNARVYRDLLGEDTVLEHHSQAIVGDRVARLATENWDAPFVVTTTVQLFESLFARTPERMRKLHRLADAVIVLDEVQALPTRLLVPILDALRLLVTHFGATVLLTSATQPAFEMLSVWRTGEGGAPLPIHPVIADPVPLFRRARRVSYRWRADRPVRMAQLAAELAGHPQVLTVVNTTVDARRLARLLHARGAPVVHLSTYMCPHHRRICLDTIRERLDHGDPVSVVSTQLIEAGVDLDFPRVCRERCPAESVQQAAGRANRDGHDRGEVIVFALSDGTPPPTAYVTPTACTETHFAGDRIEDVDDPDRLTAYYWELYGPTRLHLDPPDPTNSSMRSLGQQIQAARAALDYPEAARLFRMIDTEGVPVIVDYASGGTVARCLAELRGGTATMSTWRDLQPWIVQLPADKARHADRAGHVVPVVGDAWEWVGPYDDLVGIAL